MPTAIVSAAEVGVFAEASELAEASGVAEARELAEAIGVAEARELAAVDAEVMSSLELTEERSTIPGLPLVSQT
jgi:hypothetical protein